MPAMTDFRATLIELIEDTFQQEPDPLFAEVHDGRLPRLMGSDGNYAGVSPDNQAPTPTQRLDQQTTVTVQFYMKYEKTKPINPKLVLSPALAESTVETFQTAVREQIGEDTSGERWFWDITAIQYPPDPIGQKTRAEITLVARGNNPALVETTP